KESIPKVQAILAEEKKLFSEWNREFALSPIINQIKDNLEQVRKEEVARWLKNASPEEATIIEEVSKSLIQKVLKMPVLQLKAACKRGNPEQLAEVLRDLFTIERVKQR
ncbi:MAG: glutamyl-tRNA reductase, partial [Bacteroidia bacterium]|nr:glutamyl-tRNA reductase [Bacteroidia bacterium]